MSKCSNLWYSWVTCVILSNFCNFSRLVLSTHPLLLSNFCHFLTLCYLFTFYVIYAPYKCTCCTYYKHHSDTHFLVCTLAAPIHFPDSTDVFGQGGSRHGWGFRYIRNTFWKVQRAYKLLIKWSVNLKLLRFHYLKMLVVNMKFMIKSFVTVSMQICVAKIMTQSLRS